MLMIYLLWVEFLYIFYGCADKRIGFAEIELKEIKKLLKRI